MEVSKAKGLSVPLHPLTHLVNPTAPFRQHLLPQAKKNPELKIKKIVENENKYLHN